MAAEILQLGAVTVSLGGLLVIPFLPIAFFLFRGCQWPQVLLAALSMGCSIQAALGMLWSHQVGAQPLGEIVTLTLTWLALLLWSWKHSVGPEVHRSEKGAAGNHGALVLILGIGFAVRTIHPLDAAYLGQSDAYTHLNYLHNIVEVGCLSNPTYPAGFHWILALPGLVFSIDPYLIARYAGAFFGTGLILGIYVLLSTCVSRRSALLGSFFAAAFPGMMLLMKTGVGVFANQFGLMLLPVIFWFYIQILYRENGFARFSIPLTFVLCGLAAAVPMMLLHVLLIFGFERLLTLLRKRSEWLRKTLKFVLICLPAIILFTFHISQVGPKQRFETATIMTDYREEIASVSKTIADRVEEETASRFPGSGRVLSLVTQSPYFTLLLDYSSVKRLGFGSRVLDILGGSLAILFSGLILAGLVRNHPGFLVIGIWGLLTSVQAGTGFFQFSAYQREGWSLLIATCCLSGIMAARIYRFGESFRLFRYAVLALMVISAAWAFSSPPGHPKLRSSAEDELVRTIRLIGQGPSDWSKACSAGDHLYCNMQDLLADDLQLILVTRRFIGWRNQGEIAPNVLPPDSGIDTITVNMSGGETIFQPGFQYLVLVDEENVLSGGQLLSAFAMVSPAMVKVTLKNQRHLFKANEKILAQVRDLSEHEWSTESIRVTDRLTAILVVPTTEIGLLK